MLLEDENEELEVDGIYIAPPQVNIDSDEDSADEDEGGLIDDLTGRQLRADAKIALRNGNRISNEDVLRAVHQTSSTPLHANNNWTRDDLVKLDHIFPEANLQQYRDLSPVQFFELFIDEEVVQHLVMQSNQHALFKNYPELKLTVEELKCVLGILINTGYNENPQRKLNWDQGDDVRNYMVYEAIRRDRFVQIMQSMHCADNTQLNDTDKFTKLRPILDLLKGRFLKHFNPTRDLSFDESMIKYYGKHGCKQFIRGKPIRFGYKACCLNQTNGYLVNLELYEGARPNPGEEDALNVGKAATPLIRMIDELPEDIMRLPFRFYFDNLFIGMNLLYHLKSLEFGATGTIRQNRIPKKCPIVDSNEMKKKPVVRMIMLPMVE